MNISFMKKAMIDGGGGVRAGVWVRDLVVVVRVGRKEGALKEEDMCGQKALDQSSVENIFA